jgi:hypothetical protein
MTKTSFHRLVTVAAISLSAVLLTHAQSPASVTITLVRWPFT